MTFATGLIVEANGLQEGPSYAKSLTSRRTLFGRLQTSEAWEERIGESSYINSKAAQLRENGTEVVHLFARVALGASFLSAVADRLVMSLFPSSSTMLFAWAATAAETFFGILLIAGLKIRIVSALSGLLLLSFAVGMATELGIKTPFDYSVFSAAAAAFLLAFSGPDRFTLDKLLNRLRN